MVKQTLIDRSPVRFFDQATNGGLKAGEMGILISKKGLGKTAVLVQIGLDMLLQEKQVVHVSFNQHTNAIITWYEDIFWEMSKKKNLSNPEEIKNELISKRIILNFNQNTVSAGQIVNTLKALLAGGIPTACLIIDGLNFSKVQQDDIATLKNYAAEAGFVIWATCNCENEDPCTVMNKQTAEQINTIVHLEQKNDAIDMQVLKMHCTPVKGINLKLDTKTLLMVEK
ncbi:hypothetical protein H0R92_05600 [Treponema sp. OMZ 840]|uniref:hypothetical protein n=1 Tax=Treponema sp. OMZ 840 TaxID=244313 RepID=UPI003D8EF920